MSKTERDYTTVTWVDPDGNKHKNDKVRVDDILTVDHPHIEGKQIQFKVTSIYDKGIYIGLALVNYPQMDYPRVSLRNWKHYSRLVKIHKAGPRRRNIIQTSDE